MSAGSLKLSCSWSHVDVKVVATFYNVGAPPKLLKILNGSQNFKTPPKNYQFVLLGAVSLLSRTLFKSSRDGDF